jgi:hypothetical protein
LLVLDGARILSKISYSRPLYLLYKYKVIFQGMPKELPPNMSMENVIELGLTKYLNDGLSLSRLPFL